MLKPTVVGAIKELEDAYGTKAVTRKEDGNGGALVVVDPVPLGPPYAQADTWAGFHITHLHPDADIYPIHVRGDLSRIDGGGLGAATQKTTFDGRESIQLSRASNHRDPATFSALLKLHSVMTWLLAK
jgi:hypothetical protein